MTRIKFTAGFSSAQTTNPATVKKIEGYLSSLEKIGYSGTVLVALDGKPEIQHGFEENV